MSLGGMERIESEGGMPSVYCDSEKLGFVCGPLETVFHRHFAIQMTIGLDGPFTIQLAGDEPSRREAVLISTENLHRFAGDAGKHLFLLINPLSHLGLKLDSAMMSRDPAVGLTKARIDQLRDSVLCSQSDHTNESLYTASVRIIEDWYSHLPERAMDDRVLRALEECRCKEARELSLTQLARIVYLSESRLSHLFKQEAGISVRRYLKWHRTLEAVKRIEALNATLTEIAHEVGFSDLAHLTRTFKEMFGMTPSSIQAQRRSARPIASRQCGGY